MSYVRIWIHIVFSTKYRQQVLDKEARFKLFTHIKEQCRLKEIYLDHIGGYTDHVHLLISLGKKQSIADVVQLIKGESSFWTNKQGFLPSKLQWQDDYYAVSVSQSNVDKVRTYIRGQEEHHKKKTFHQEADEFMVKYGWHNMKDEN